MIAVGACGRVAFDPVAGSSFDGATTGRCATAVFTNSPASAFTDNFSSGNLAATWTPVDPCIAESGSELVASPLPSGRYCHAWTQGDWHLSCDAITVHVPEAAAQVRGVQTYVYVQDVSGGPLLELLLEAGGFQLTSPSIGGTYDAVMDAWWRLGELDGTVYFDVSADGVTFTRMAQVASPFSLDHVAVAIGAGTYKPVTSPGQARFHCYNVPPPCM